MDYGEIKSRFSDFKAPRVGEPKPGRPDRLENPPTNPVMRMVRERGAGGGDWKPTERVAPLIAVVTDNEVEDRSKGSRTYHRDGEVVDGDLHTRIIGLGKIRELTKPGSEQWAVAVVPLEYYRELLAPDIGDLKLNRTAVIIEYSAQEKNGDTLGRPGKFQAILLTNDGAARSIQNKIEENPELAKEIMEAANNGPLKGVVYDPKPGQEMRIIRGFDRDGKPDKEKTQTVFFGAPEPTASSDPKLEPPKDSAVERERFLVPQQFKIESVSVKVSSLGFKEQTKNDPEINEGLRSILGVQDKEILKTGEIPDDKNLLVDVRGMSGGRSCITAYDGLTNISAQVIMKDGPDKIEDQLRKDPEILMRTLRRLDQEEKLSDGWKRGERLGNENPDRALVFCKDGEEIDRVPLVGTKVEPATPKTEPVVAKIENQAKVGGTETETDEEVKAVKEFVGAIKYAKISRVPTVGDIVPSAYVGKGEKGDLNYSSEDRADVVTAEIDEVAHLKPGDVSMFVGRVSKEQDPYRRILIKGKWLGEREGSWQVEALVPDMVMSDFQKKALENPELVRRAVKELAGMVSDDTLRRNLEEDLKEGAEKGGKFLFYKPNDKGQLRFVEIDKEKFVNGIFEGRERGYVSQRPRGGEDLKKEGAEVDQEAEKWKKLFENSYVEFGAYNQGFSGEAAGQGLLQDSFNKCLMDNLSQMDRSGKVVLMTGERGPGKKLAVIASDLPAEDPNYFRFAGELTVEQMKGFLDAVKKDPTLALRVVDLVGRGELHLLQDYKDRQTQLWMVEKGRVSERLSFSGKVVEKPAEEVDFWSTPVGNAIENAAVGAGILLATHRELLRSLNLPGVSPEEVVRRAKEKIENDKKAEARQTPPPPRQEEGRGEEPRAENTSRAEGKKAPSYTGQATFDDLEGVLEVYMDARRPTSMQTEVSLAEIERARMIRAAKKDGLFVEMKGVVKSELERLVLRDRQNREANYPQRDELAVYEDHIRGLDVNAYEQQSPVDAAPYKGMLEEYRQGMLRNSSILYLRGLRDRGFKYDKDRLEELEAEQKIRGWGGLKQGTVEAINTLVASAITIRERQGTVVREARVEQERLEEQVRRPDIPQQLNSLSGGGQEMLLPISPEKVPPLIEGRFLEKWGLPSNFRIRNITQTVVVDTARALDAAFWRSGEGAALKNANADIQYITAQAEGVDQEHVTRKAVFLEYGLPLLEMVIPQTGKFVDLAKSMDGKINLFGISQLLKNDPELFRATQIALQADNLERNNRQRVNVADLREEDRDVSAELGRQRDELMKVNYLVELTNSETIKKGFDKMAKTIAGHTGTDYVTARMALEIAQLLDGGPGVQEHRKLQIKWGNDRFLATSKSKDEKVNGPFLGRLWVSLSAKDGDLTKPGDSVSFLDVVNSDGLMGLVNRMDSNGQDLMVNYIKACEGMDKTMKVLGNIDTWLGGEDTEVVALSAKEIRDKCIDALKELATKPPLLEEETRENIIQTIVATGKEGVDYRKNLDAKTQNYREEIREVNRRRMTVGYWINTFLGKKNY